MKSLLPHLDTIATSTNVPLDPDMPTSSFRWRDAPAGQCMHLGRQPAAA
jgi:hypothetical protein